MQWWSRRRPAEQRTLGVAQPLLPTSGVVAPANALAVADVYACVRVLSDAAASCPLIVYRRTEAGRVRVSNRTADLLRHPGMHGVDRGCHAFPGRTLYHNLLCTVTVHVEDRGERVGGRVGQLLGLPIVIAYERQRHDGASNELAHYNE